MGQEEDARPGICRRDFLSATSTTAGIAFVLPASRPNIRAKGLFQGPFCLFSKHLPQLDWTSLAKRVKEAGFDGVDLTVRPGGHVLPENAARDLPRAVNAIRSEGVQVPMITTALTSSDDPAAEPILATAGGLSIPYYKPGYYHYAYNDIRSELRKAGEELRQLVALGARHRVQLGFHNHAGYLGAPVWDADRVLGDLDPKWAGFYFDVRHAVAEGGDAGWKIAFLLVASRLKMIAVKDFYWERGPAGWRQVNCPLGEGMVDWKAYCSLLAAAGFQGPVSVHLEYPIPGDSPEDEEQYALKAARRDLEFIKDQMTKAYST